MLRHVSCPRCRADNAERQYPLVATSLVTCVHCKLTYVNPLPGSEALEHKLQQWAQQDVIDRERLRLAFEPATLEYYGRLLARLAPHARGPGRALLDVGCSTGAFLKVAQSAGWNAQGLEIGAASARYASEVLGLTVARASIYSFQDVPERYDAIAMIEVIEHLEDPRRALDRLYGWLRSGGVLLVTTPNFDSLYRRLFGTRWWVINCEDEHIVLFTLASLCGMLADAGFEILDRRIQNLDVLGLVREGLRRQRRPSAGPAGPVDALGGYYTGRSAKAHAKQLLQRLGVLRAARGLLRSLDHTYTWRASPTYSWGEQLVVVARRP